MKNLLLVLVLISFAQMLFAQTSNPPHIVDNSPQGVPYTSVGYEHASNGTVYAMDSYIYLKNIGGSGEINVTITVGKYIEIKQFTVDSNTAYKLTSHFPVSDRGIKGNINITASFSGTPGLTIDNSVSSTNYYATDTSSSTLSLVTGVEQNHVQIPICFSLDQNYPNPFNPTTTITFSIPSKSFITLKVFDILGREVASIVSEELSEGKYSFQWNAVNISSGIYFYQLHACSFTQTKKLVLLR